MHTLAILLHIIGLSSPFDGRCQSSLARTGPFRPQLPHYGLAALSSIKVNTVKGQRLRPVIKLCYKWPPERRHRMSNLSNKGGHAHVTSPKKLGFLDPACLHTATDVVCKIHVTLPISSTRNGMPFPTSVDVSHEWSLRDWADIARLSLEWIESIVCDGDLDWDEGSPIQGNLGIDRRQRSRFFDLSQEGINWAPMEREPKGTYFRYKRWLDLGVTGFGTSAIFDFQSFYKSEIYGSERCQSKQTNMKFFTGFKGPDLHISIQGS